MSNTQKITKLEEYYTSGNYFREHESSCSAVKVDLAIPFLKKNNIDLKSGSKFIEVGCGSGEFFLPLAEYLHSKNINTVMLGYDISRQAINKANKKNKYQNVSFHIGSSEHISKGADIIFCMDVVEHVENPFEFLRNLACKSEWLLLHLPIEQSIGHMLLNKPKKSNIIFRHIHFYSWQSARLLLKELPFEIVDYQFTAASVPAIKIKGNPIIRLLRLIRFLLYQLNTNFSALLGGGSVLFLLKNKAESITP